MNIIEMLDDIYNVCNNKLNDNEQNVCKDSVNDMCKECHDILGNHLYDLCNNVIIIWLMERKMVICLWSARMEPRWKPENE